MDVLRRAAGWLSDYFLLEVNVNILLVLGNNEMSLLGR